MLDWEVHSESVEWRHGDTVDDMASVDMGDYSTILSRSVFVWIELVIRVGPATLGLILGLALVLEGCTLFEGSQACD